MDRFAALFAETMPPDADAIDAELGLTRDDVERLPHEVGELREVDEDGAVALYERRGFEVVGERLGFLLMRKPV